MSELVIGSLSTVSARKVIFPGDNHNYRYLHLVELKFTVSGPGADFIIFH